MERYHNIPVLPETHVRLKAFARRHNHSPHQQIMEWLDQAERAESEHLPHPEGGQTIPIYFIPIRADKACQCEFPLMIQVMRAGWPPGPYCAACGGHIEEVKDGPNNLR